MWGPSDSSHTLANKAFPGKLPQVARRLRNFHLTEAQLGSLEASIQAAGQGHTAQGVRQWIAEHPGIADTLTPVPGS